MSCRKIDKGVSSTSLVKNLNAERLEGHDYKSVASYRHMVLESADIKHTSLSNAGFFDYSITEEERVELGYPTKRGCFIHCNNNVSVEGQLIIAIGEDRLYHRVRNINITAKDNPWIQIANLKDLDNLVSRDEFEKVITELKNNQSMQLTENQSQMGGGIRRFALEDTSFVVTVRQKGGSHELPENRFNKSSLFKESRKHTGLSSRNGRRGLFGFRYYFELPCSRSVRMVNSQKFLKREKCFPSVYPIRHSYKNLYRTVVRGRLERMAEVTLSIRKEVAL